MWQGNREQNPQGPRRRTIIGAMAHRRGRVGRRIASGAASVLAIFLLLTASVVVSNRVAGLRTEIAALEDQRELLAAASASLLLEWNKATAPAVITERARTGLGLVAPMDPGLVLVQLPADGQRTSPWRRLLDRMGGGVAAAEAAPAPVLGTMVSLTPRAARGRGSER